jgi:hypothetical protein
MPQPGVAQRTPGSGAMTIARTLKGFDTAAGTVVAFLRDSVRRHWQKNGWQKNEEVSYPSDAIRPHLSATHFSAIARYATPSA